MTQTQGERVKRAALRCGVRAIVVAGFASAAWLLSSAAAHAAPAEQDATAPAQLDLPVLRLVADLDHEVLGTNLLTPAPAATPEAPARTVADVPCLDGTECVSAVPVPDQQPAPPAGGLARVLQGIAAPLGLGDVVTVTTTLVSPLTRALDPVIDPLEPVLRPVTSTLDASVSGARIGRLKAAAAPRTGNPAVVAAEVPAAEASVPVPATESSTGPATAALTVVGTTFRAAQPRGPGGGKLPQLPEPTPVKSPLGTGSGASTNGSGSHTDGGSSAVVSSSTVTGAVASHRGSRAVDVVVPRPDAEDPTFSPD